MIYCYDDPFGHYEFTRQEILDSYLDHWKARMVKAGRQHLITEENCVEDWCLIHWAYVKK